MANIDLLLDVLQRMIAFEDFVNEYLVWPARV